MSVSHRVWMAVLCFSLAAHAQNTSGSAPTSQAPNPASPPTALQGPPTALAVPAAESAANSSVAEKVSPERHIVLDVMVTDRSGRLVTGLQQQDFTVLDNKAPQKPLYFHAIDAATDKTVPPVQVVLLVDAANTEFRHVAQARQQIDKYLQQNGGKLAVPTSIALLNDAGAQMQSEPFQDGNALSKSLDQADSTLRMIGRSTGDEGAVERFQLSLNTIQMLGRYEATKPGRKLLIWVSPGWPLLSGPDVQLTEKEQLGLFNSVVAVSTALRQARITLYNVDPLGTSDAGGFRTFFYKEFLKGVSKPSQVQVGNLALQVMAEQSGGLVLNSSNDVAEEIARCAQEAGAYYVLSIDAPLTDTRNIYHSIEVRVDRPGLTARTRMGYYAQP